MTHPEALVPTDSVPLEQDRQLHHLDLPGYESQQIRSLRSDVLHVTDGMIMVVPNAGSRWASRMSPSGRRTYHTRQLRQGRWNLDQAHGRLFCIL